MTDPRGEAARKTLHIALSAVAALVVWIATPVVAATVLAAATLVALAVEAARQLDGGFGAAFQRRLGGMLREREARRLTGATTLSLGYTVAAVALPGAPALAGILFTGVADALAAVVGRRLGRTRYPGGKSLEGTVAFATAAFVLALGIPGIGVAVAAAVALVLSVIEAFTLPVDDNLYLPLVGAAVVRAALELMGSGRFP